MYRDKYIELDDIDVLGGISDKCKLYYNDFGMIVEKSVAGKIERKVEINSPAIAPIKEGDELGKITYIYNGETLGENKIFAKENVEKISFWNLISKMLQCFLLKQ